jgi:hypothetical protein
MGVTKAKVLVDMMAHDRLPVDVRRALGQTIRKWSSVSALECIEVHGLHERQVINMILTMDWDHAVKEGGGRQNPEVKRVDKG